MMEYWMKALSVWWLGFVPFLEIYVAIPAGVALQLDYVSVAAWSIFGNFAAVPVLIVTYDRLVAVERVRGWLERLQQGRARRLIERYGVLIVLVGTPWIGVWAVAAASLVMGIRRGTLLLYSFVSVAVYGIALTALIALGLDVFRR